ncbi:hypothetical protein ACFFHH_13050 [Cytobacillus solani]|uniref:hypothetical protein n=1 Tax=Cytobacillus solani TaxID=1637975 RepID=UPI000AB621D2|nr:hypothetical protein [Cytobacillus solani]
MTKSVSKAIKEAKASLAVEGLYMKPEIEKLIEMKMTNKISEEEFKYRVTGK